MVLIDRHRLATSSSHQPHHELPPAAGGGMGLLGLAAMGVT
jgi:hypothetical protein